MPGRRHDHEGILMWVWYLDRGSALIAYAALWLSAMLGILYNARAFGFAHRLSRRLHVPASVLALVTLAIHAVVGTLDAWLVASGAVPHPRFSDLYLTLGALVGLAALLLLVTATLAFLDAKAFERPWDPRTVHLLAYGGFAFATIHAVAIGSDLWSLALPPVLAGTLLLVSLLVVRALTSRERKAAATSRS